MRYKQLGIYKHVIFTFYGIPLSFPYAENIYILFRQGMKCDVIYFDIRATCYVFGNNLTDNVSSFM